MESATEEIAASGKYLHAASLAPSLAPSLATWEVLLIWNQDAVSALVVIAVGFHLSVWSRIGVKVQIPARIRAIREQEATAVAVACG